MSNALQWRLLPIAQILTGLGILIFWLAFFTIGIAPENPPACYFAFEHAFPAPDAILAIALISSGINIVRHGRWGHSVSLACAGGLLFLGVIDASFTAQNGGFSGPIDEALMSGVISLWCIGVGLWIIALHARDEKFASTSGA